MSKRERQPPVVAEAIPPVLQLAWGLRDGGSRGPKRGLTLERIVAAGIKPYRRQPWVLRVPISGPPYGPNNLAWLDNGLAALGDTPLPEADKASTVLLLSGFVRNVATLSADFAAGSAAEAVMPGYGTVLTQLTTAEQFPALHRAIASGVFDDDDEIEIELEFGLERILDGVAVLIQRTGPSRKERPR